ncbi:MAG: hypothetical protein V3T31_06975, partial [candidate division Zixibacteria bacterium]
DAVGIGSTAFRIGGEASPVIYIESFPERKACEFDPFEITKADLIIQNVHGHTTHYDPDVCARVAAKTGALVLGNERFKKEMLKRGIPAEKFIELSPEPGKKVSATVESLGLKVTSYKMEHTSMTGFYVDTYLLEMADGVRWYHGTCSSGPETIKWMLLYPELKDLDLMLLDCDMDFAVMRTLFSPRAMIKTHDFKSEIKPAPATVYTDYPAGEHVLENGHTWVLKPQSNAAPDQ